MLKPKYKMYSQEAGFTLVEMMITLVIAMTILGGLLLNFTTQSAQYKYQDKRIDAAQDLEFAIRYIASDLQGALVSVDEVELDDSGAATTRSIEGLASGTNPSTFMSFITWDEANAAGADMRVRRCYRFDGGMIKYDVDDSGCSSSTTINDNGAIIGEAAVGLKGMQVTHFRVFQDGLNDADRANYSNIPRPLPEKEMRDNENNSFFMPSFTLLIELEVDAVSKGSSVDVLGNAVTNNKRRIWRYMQVYPSVLTEG